MWAQTAEAIDRLASSFCRPLRRPFSTPSRRAGRFRLPAWWQAWRERAALRAELQQLSPRTLADLGISRADFPAIIAGTFRKDGEGYEADRR
jgi:uncharacterized protein YjiS (DUF1127 family)